MSRRLLRCLALLPFLAAPAYADAPFVKFQPQEIATDLTIGYAVAAADINEDGKPDIVVADKHRVLWYENPTWKPRLILNGKTRPDNVCLALLDIDGDGHLDIVLGAGWMPSNTKTGGTLQWLKRGKTLDEEWTVYPIGEEPTIHRVRVADLDGNGPRAVVVAPLMGRDSTPKANWMDGRPVRILAYPVPKDPVKGPWKPEVLDESLHVVHNFAPIFQGRCKPDAILCASYEGVTQVRRDGATWKNSRLGAGNQSNPKGSRGASEIKLGRLKAGSYIATVEPWHGNQVVVYTDKKGPDGLLKRFVIDEQLRWGHAVWCADLDGDGDEELIIGVRDDPTKDDKFTERRGVRVYKCTDDKGEKWRRQIVENGGVAVEDLTAADLDGDGKTDIIAVGRQTHNLRVYWNRGK